MLYFARHTKITKKVVIVKIRAKSKEEAEKLNENWQIGMRNDPDRVEVVDRVKEVRDYTVSYVRKNNDF